MAEKEKFITQIIKRAFKMLLLGFKGLHPLGTCRERLFQLRDMGLEVCVRSSTRHGRLPMPEAPSWVWNTLGDGWTVISA
jgi:hypothetical protein